MSDSSEITAAPVNASARIGSETSSAKVSRKREQESRKTAGCSFSEDCLSYSTVISSFIWLIPTNTQTKKPPFLKWNLFVDVSVNRRGRAAPKMAHLPDRAAARRFEEEKQTESV